LNDEAAISVLENGDTMEIRWENGLGGSGGLIRIFFFATMHEFQSKKKSVGIRPIRPIRSPIVSPFSKAEIAIN
jgi:hypothetical protein